MGQSDVGGVLASAQSWRVVGYKGTIILSERLVIAGSHPPHQYFVSLQSIPDFSAIETEEEIPSATRVVAVYELFQGPFDSVYGNCFEYRFIGVEVR